MAVAAGGMTKAVTASLTAFARPSTRGLSFEIFLDRNRGKGYIRQQVPKK